jgi:hypothetical protein
MHSGPLVSGFLISVAVAGTGCGSVLGFVAGVNLSNADAHPAHNPFGGGELAYREPARDQNLQNVSERDCSTWPLVDEFHVRVDGDQLCLEATTTYGIGPAYSGASGGDPHWAFAGDGGKLAVIAGSSESQKVGECLGGSTTYSVWRRSVSGCAANNGVLTATSSKLSLRTTTGAVKYDLAAWKFQ